LPSRSNKIQSLISREGHWSLNNVPIIESIIFKSKLVFQVDQFGSRMEENESESKVVFKKKKEKSFRKKRSIQPEEEGEDEIKYVELYKIRGLNNANPSKNNRS
jgi:hypothetical protein